MWVQKVTRLVFGRCVELGNLGKNTTLIQIKLFLACWDLFIKFCDVPYSTVRHYILFLTEKRRAAIDKDQNIVKYHQRKVFCYRYIL